MPSNIARFHLPLRWLGSESWQLMVDQIFRRHSSTYGKLGSSRLSKDPIAKLSLDLIDCWDGVVRSFSIKVGNLSIAAASNGRGTINPRARVTSGFLVDLGLLFDVNLGEEDAIVKGGRVVRLFKITSPRKQ
jgi:hypothetical protein